MSHASAQEHLGREGEMTRAVLMTMCLAVAGCALPRYETRLVPLVSNPAAPQAQAVAICGPEAQLASANARANAQARVDSRNNQVTGYDCNTQGSTLLCQAVEGAA
jgi:hypothetical protein